MDYQHLLNKLSLTEPQRELGREKGRELFLSSVRILVASSATSVVEARGTVGQIINFLNAVVKSIAEDGEQTLLRNGFLRIACSNIALLECVLSEGLDNLPCINAIIRQQGIFLRALSAWMIQENIYMPRSVADVVKIKCSESDKKRTAAARKGRKELKEKCQAEAVLIYERLKSENPKLTRAAAARAIQAMEQFRHLSDTRTIYKYLSQS